MFALWLHAVAVGAPPEGLAACCLCMPRDDPPPRLLPEDGATDFPTDGVLHVVAPTNGPLYALVALEYRIVGPDGVVPAHASATAGLATFRPDAPLRPHAQYTVERAFTYLDGSRDEALGLRFWRDASRGRDSDLAGWERIWYPVSSFVTSAGPDRRVVPPPTVAAASLLDRPHPCGAGEELTAAITLGEELGPWDLLTVEVGGRLVVPWTEGGMEHFEVTLGDAGCPAPGAVHVETDEQGQATFRPVVLTTAGRRVAAAQWTQISAAHHTPRPSREQVDPNDLAARMALVPFAARPSIQPGPAWCPYGLRGTGPREVPEPRPSGVGLIWRDGALLAYERSGKGRWWVGAERGASRGFAATTAEWVFAGWRDEERGQRWALFERETGYGFSGGYPEGFTADGAAPGRDDTFVVAGGFEGERAQVEIRPPGVVTTPAPVVIGPRTASGAQIEVEVGEVVETAEWGARIAILSRADGRHFLSSADRDTGAVSRAVPVARGGALVVTEDGFSLRYQGSAVALGLDSADRWVDVNEPLVCLDAPLQSAPYRLPARE